MHYAMGVVCSVPLISFHVSAFQNVKRSHQLIDVDATIV